MNSREPALVGFPRMRPLVSDTLLLPHQNEGGTQIIEIVRRQPPMYMYMFGLGFRVIGARLNL